MNSGTVVDAAGFMSRYVAALDRRDLEAWCEFFAAEAAYTVASFENHAAGLPLLFINDDSRSKIADRVRLVRDFWHGSFNDYLPRHVLSFPMVLDEVDGKLRLEQNFAMYTTETDLGSATGGTSQLVCVGRYLVTTVGNASERKLSRLEVILDTSTLPQSLVYPV